jgi:hypothetical protein
MCGWLMPSMRLATFPTMIFFGASNGSAVLATATGSDAGISAKSQMPNSSAVDRDDVTIPNHNESGSVANSADELHLILRLTSGITLRVARNPTLIHSTGFSGTGARSLSTRILRMEIVLPSRRAIRVRK